MIQLQQQLNNPPIKDSPFGYIETAITSLFPILTAIISQINFLDVAKANLLHFQLENAKFSSF